MRLYEAKELFMLALVGETSERTQGWYDQQLRAFLTEVGDMDVKAVTIHDLRQWRKTLYDKEALYESHPTVATQPGGYSPYTIHGRLRSVRRFFNWMVEEGILDESPAERLNLPALPNEPPKAVSEADLERMLNTARSHSARDYALICFLADTGCRVGGLVRLVLNEVDVDEGTAIVREKGGSGQRKVRRVYFGGTTAEALREWLAERPESAGDRVFLGERGPLTESGVYQVLKRTARRAGVEGRYNPHAFRHAWARAALQKGADLATVAQVLGHSDVQVTHRHYARWSDRELAEHARRFSPLGGAETDTQ